MNKQNPVLERSYHIPLSMFGKAFRAFQKKYVYPRNWILTVVLAAIAGVYVHAVISDPEQKLAYLLIVACAAMIAVTWYNTFKIRRSLMTALKEIESDTYELTVFADGITVLAKDEDGNPFEVVEEPLTAQTAPEEPAQTSGEAEDGSGFREIFPEEPKRESEPLAPTEIDFAQYGRHVKITEHDEFFMVYVVTIKNFYVIPKSAFSEQELEKLRSVFANAGKQG